MKAALKIISTILKELYIHTYIYKVYKVADLTEVVFHLLY